MAFNLEKGIDACRRAAALGVDLILFPELWSIGASPFAEQGGAGASLWREPQAWPAGSAAARTNDADIAAAHARAIGRGSEFILRHRRLARELDTAIAITYLESWPGAPRNTVSVIDARGEMLLTYAKVHTCCWMPTEGAFTPGDGFEACTLPTAGGAVRLGAMICYDREFPERARELMLGGAEIIITPNCCPLEQSRLSQFRARAFENAVGVAMANYPRPKENGHSVAYQPCMHDDNGSRDQLVVEVGEGEEIVVADFDLDEIRAWRRRSPWGNAYRRPARYGRIAASEVEEPFVRVNARGERFADVGRDRAHDHGATGAARSDR